MNVWILAIYHEHGTDLKVFDNDEKAREAIYNYVVNNWTTIEGEMPKDPADAISDYFGLRIMSEGYEITECPVL